MHPGFLLLCQPFPDDPDSAKVLISYGVLLSLRETVKLPFMNVDTLLRQYFPQARNACIELFLEDNTGLDKLW